LARPIAAAPIAPSDVLVRVRAAGLSHTDLEMVDGSPRQSTFRRAPCSNGR
jgi:D-arabinose 1-dehydrogenase-like Zn-dependent alcohol dehydrogenase